MSPRPASWSGRVRNVLVTGGTQGIGLGIARRLAQAGYCVIAVARRSRPEWEAASREVEQHQHGALHFRPFDLAEVSGIPDLVKRVRGDFGAIYGLVNNAGLGTPGVLATMPNAQIARLVNLNVVAPITLTKYVVRGMMADGGGRVVNIASIMGFTGYKGLSVYGATKASMMGFTRSLAREVGSLGVNVNAIAPGFIATDMTGGMEQAEREQIVRRSALRRLAEVEDVANAVEFLLGDASRNVTGTVMTVDAGSTA